MRAVFGRSVEAPGAPWRFVSTSTRTTYGRDRLGAMLGLSPPELARVAPPENCTEKLCTWRAPHGLRFALALDRTSAEGACGQGQIQGQIVFARAPVAADFQRRCGALSVIDAASVARAGGGFIYETPRGFSVVRNTAQRRAWSAAEAEGDD